jgi:hypothetical protein
MARLYGPAVRYKPDVNKWRVVLRFCIRPLHGAIVLLAIMDNGSLMGQRCAPRASKPPRHSLSRSGREHGRSIPLCDIDYYRHPPL